MLSMKRPSPPEHLSRSIHPGVAPEDRWSMDLARLTDEQLVERARQAPGAEARLCLQLLYRRFHLGVSSWCLRVRDDPEQAADLAKEIFLQAHARLGSYRHDGRFSTWLYQMAHSVAIERGREEDRAGARLGGFAPGSILEDGELLDRFRQVMARDLEPLEGRILYLRYTTGLSLDAISALLALDETSSAKLCLASAEGKLQRLFGPSPRRLLGQ